MDHVVEPSPRTRRERGGRAPPAADPAAVIRGIGPALELAFAADLGPLPALIDGLARQLMGGPLGPVRRKRRASEAAADAV